MDTINKPDILPASSVAQPPEPKAAVEEIVSRPSSIYFYGVEKSAGDAPVKQMYMITKQVTTLQEPAATPIPITTSTDTPTPTPTPVTITTTTTTMTTEPIATTMTTEPIATTMTTEPIATTAATITTELTAADAATAPTTSTSISTSSSTSTPTPAPTEADDKGRKRTHEKPTAKSAKKQRVAAQSGICLKIASGEPCPFGEKCKYSHDPAVFLASKAADLGDVCYMFTTYGYCPYGLSCRYGTSHIKDFKHVTNEELLAKMGKPLIINAIKKETQVALRKDRRDFPKSEPLIKKYASLQQGTQVPIVIPPSASTLFSSLPAAVAKPVSVPAKTTIEFPPELDVETKLRAVEKKQLDLKGKLYLAPLTTNGNLPFRRICKTLGADITCGEMALASNLLKGQASEWALLRRHPSEDVFGIQVCGAFVDQMTYCAELIEQENLDVDFVDINSGCPIDIICNKGMGSALLDKPRRIEGILRSMSSVLTRPLTIKIRTGRDDKSSMAHKLIPSLKLWGADAVTLHGRTRVQRYSKVADWDYINTCSQISPIPLIGNGDIYNWQEAVHYMENTNISSIMIARSAIIKPWIFTEIKERRDWDISATERLDMLKTFGNYGLEHWGSDTQGVEKTRNFLLNWISFMCRYVPVGLLERLPSRINERPPLFYGRSDLETLLGSRKVSDWVKLSEMVLGPVPSDFHFEPKHKSNSYEDAQG